MASFGIVVWTGEKYVALEIPVHAESEEQAERIAEEYVRHSLPEWVMTGVYEMDA